MQRRAVYTLWKQIKGFCLDLMIACVFVFLLNQFIIQNQKVEGHSMEPTMKQGDMVLMNKIIYHFKEPQAGDVIGFYSEKVDKQLVKRIFGVPGDVIDFKNNMLYCNDHPILEDEIYAILKQGDIRYPYTVPEDNYFVIGDNYNESIDSRYHYIGSVPRDAISGRIKVRLWPLGNSPFIQ